MKLIGKFLTLIASVGAVASILVKYGIVKLKPERKLTFSEKLFKMVTAFILMIFGCKASMHHKKTFGGLNLSFLPFFSK